jgi:hypothetical protein
VTGAWDEAAWGALVAELDVWRAQGRAATFCWRDDDAGGAHRALDRLLTLAGRSGLPLGLAVVPAWLTPDGVAAIGAAPATMVVLQHGFAHANHETAPPPGSHKIRPAECGTARPVEPVLDEIRRGQERLLALGPRVVPVFVPPWNRIAPAVREHLPMLGFRALSAFGPRGRPVPGLVELHCHVDPILWRESGRFAGAAETLTRLRTQLAARRTGQADPGEPTGLLTHHQAADAALWAFLDRLLTQLPDHPAATFPSWPTLLDAASASRRP